jgi:hypothetical protein
MNLNPMTTIGDTMKIKFYRVTVSILGNKWSTDYLGRPTVAEVLATIDEDWALGLKDVGPECRPRINLRYQRFRDMVLEYGLPDDRHCTHLGVTVGTIEVKALFTPRLTAGWMSALEES